MVQDANGGPQTAAEEGAQGADAQFDHLAELMRALPEMEALSARLAAADAADRVARCARALTTCSAMLTKARSGLDSERALCARALEDADEAALDEHRRGELYWGNQVSMRLAPVENARIALDAALAKGGFADEGAAAAAALEQPERARITAKIAAYQRDYARTLAQCQGSAEQSA